MVVRNIRNVSRSAAGAVVITTNPDHFVSGFLYVLYVFFHSVRFGLFLRFVFCVSWCYALCLVLCFITFTVLLFRATGTPGNCFCSGSETVCL